MKVFIASLISLVGFAAHAMAQPYFPASTVQEGIQRGAADILRGQARYLEGLGHYENLHEGANSQRIDNWHKYHKTRWSLQDERRQRLYGDTQLDQMERRLDNAERRHNLLQREQGLIDAGILPPKSAPYIVIRGRKYNTVDEWKQTADHLLCKFEGQEREMLWNIEKLDKAKQHQNSLAFESWWRGLGFSGQRHYLQKKQSASFFGEPSPSPRFEFQKLEWELDASYEVLERIRQQQAAVREFIKLRGNRVIQH